MTSYSVGLDLDTHKVSAVALFDTSEPYWAKTFEGKGKTADARFGQIVTGLADEFANMARLNVTVSSVWVEDVPFVKNRQGFASLAQILGAVRAAAVMDLPDVPIVVVRGSDWKRLLGLSGNANKDAITAWVDREADALPEGPWLRQHLVTQDLRDAYAIARASLHA